MPSIFTEQFIAAQSAKRLNEGLTWQMSKLFAEMGFHINADNQVESIVPGVAVDAANPIVAALNNYRGSLGEITTQVGLLVTKTGEKVALQGLYDALVIAKATVDGNVVTLTGQKQTLEDQKAALIAGVALLVAQVEAVPLVPAYTWVP